MYTPPTIFSLFIYRLSPSKEQQTKTWVVIRILLGCSVNCLLNKPFWILKPRLIKSTKPVVSVTKIGATHQKLSLKIPKIVLIIHILSFFWQDWWDSNPRSSDRQSDIITTILQPYFCFLLWDLNPLSTTTRSSRVFLFSSIRKKRCRTITVIHRHCFYPAVNANQRIN